MEKSECLYGISENVIRLLGLHFPESRLNDLERLVLSAARELKIAENIQSVNEWLSAGTISSHQLNVLSEHLRVGETYFFRENTALMLLKEVVIPQLLLERQGAGRNIRIWSAGCSSGEEAYTLAMLLCETIPDIRNWNITIRATDISISALNKAIQGRYTSWSFRETDQLLKDKYFIARGKEWEIIPQIRKMVSFSLLNLADDVYDPVATNTNSMDIIFCRNVLMYFTPEKARTAGRRFFHSLVDKGWFVSSQVELSEDYFEPFARIQFNNGIFYQKAPKMPLVFSNAFHALQSDYKPLPKTKPLKTEPDKKTKHPVYSSESKLVAIQKPAFAGPEKLYEKGQYLQCVDQCLALCDKGSDDLKYLLLIVKSYANMGRLQDARNWGMHLLENNNTSVEAYYFLATILLELGELQQAEAALRKALYLDHDNIQVQLTMGNVMQRQGKIQLASKCFVNIHNLLNMHEEDEAIPGLEGLTAGRVKAMVEMSIR